MVFSRQHVIFINLIKKNLLIWSELITWPAHHEREARVLCVVVMEAKQEKDKDYYDY